MADSLFSKARVAVLGNLHKLLDKVANTPEAFKQRIRDLESALADLRAATDEQVGTANGHKREIMRLTSDKASKQADIDLLLGDDDPSNDQAALELQMELETIDGQVANEQSLLDSAEANVAALQDAIDKLERKHTEMVNDLQQITATSAAAKAKNRAAEAAEAALAASDAAETASVDSIKDRINHDSDVANARFDRVIGGLQSATSPEEAAKLARAKAALEARRAQIASQAVAQAEADESNSSAAAPTSA